MGIAAMGSSVAGLLSHNKNDHYFVGMGKSTTGRESHQALVAAQLGNSLTVYTHLPDNEKDRKNCALLLLQLGISSDPLHTVIESAAQQGITLILTPADFCSARDAALACRGDFLIVSEPELEALTSMPVQSFAQREEAAKSLLHKGLRNLIITLGERGCLWMSQGKTRHVAAYEVQAVETRETGDAFIGCFAHYYAKDGDVLNALEHASLYAACCVTRACTHHAYPSLAEFQAFRP